MKRTVLLLMTFFLTAALISCAGSQAFQRGERYSHSGEWDLAVKEYREANRKEPQDIEYRSALIRAEETAANQHYKKAQNFLKERKLDQAIIELQQALYLNPTNAAIQGALRSVLDMKQAEEHYRASLTFMELGRTQRGHQRTEPGGRTRSGERKIFRFPRQAPEKEDRDRAGRRAHACFGQTHHAELQEHEHQGRLRVSVQTVGHQYPVRR